MFCGNLLTRVMPTAFFAYTVKAVFGDSCLERPHVLKDDLFMADGGVVFQIIKDMTCF